MSVRKQAPIASFCGTAEVKVYTQVPGIPTRYQVTCSECQAPMRRTKRERGLTLGIWECQGPDCRNKVHFMEE
jgi:hypothetical protein